MMQQQDRAIDTRLEDATRKRVVNKGLYCETRELLSCDREWVES